MDNQVNLKKRVYDNRQFSRVIDREFKTFTQPVSEDPFTVEDFFNEYERLYLSIPTQGEINSHEYLVKRSSELVNIEQDTSDIQPLLDEIASLRERLLEANQTIVGLEVQVETNRNE